MCDSILKNYLKSLRVLALVCKQRGQGIQGILAVIYFM